MTTADPVLQEIRQRVRDAYRGAIGRHRSELVTPALILDLDTARKNIQTMVTRMAGLPAKLRPHTKVQKSPELAQLQIAAGAIGICSATVWEAIVMRRSGIPDVLIANMAVGREKLAALANAAKDGGLSITVDDPRNATQLSEALDAADANLDVLIDVDIGMGRGGVRSAADALSLARHLTTLPRLSFKGVQGYEGHCMLEPDPQVRTAKASAAIAQLIAVADLLERDGFECRTISAAGTGTYNLTGANPRVTEIQAGSYVLMDKFHGDLVPGFSPALTVLGTVAIEHGQTIVLDVGRKSIGIDFVQPTLVAYPFYQARYFAEEHALFDVDDRCKLRLGDTAELIPGYAPTTVNLHDAYHVVENNQVVDIWPILPRGPGHLGLIH